MSQRPFDHPIAIIVAAVAVSPWCFVIKAPSTTEAEMREVVPRNENTSPLAYGVIAQPQPEPLISRSISMVKFSGEFSGRALTFINRAKNDEPLIFANRR